MGPNMLFFTVINKGGPKIVEKFNDLFLSECKISKSKNLKKFENGS